MGKQNVSISSFFSMGGRFKIGGPDDKKSHYIIVSQQKNQNKNCCWGSRHFWDTSMVSLHTRVFKPILHITCHFYLVLHLYIIWLSPVPLKPCVFFTKTTTFYFTFDEKATTWARQKALLSSQGSSLALRLWSFPGRKGFPRYPGYPLKTKVCWSWCQLLLNKLSWNNSASSTCYKPLFKQ